MSGAYLPTSATGTIIDRLAWLIIAAAIAGCAALGPPAISLTRSDIGERAFIDRSGDLSRMFRQFEGLWKSTSGPLMSRVDLAPK